LPPSSGPSPWTSPGEPFRSAPRNSRRPRVALLLTSWLLFMTACTNACAGSATFRIRCRTAAILTVVGLCRPAGRCSKAMLSQLARHRLRSANHPNAQRPPFDGHLLPNHLEPCLRKLPRQRLRRRSACLDGQRHGSRCSHCCRPSAVFGAAGSRLWDTWRGSDRCALRPRGVCRVACIGRSDVVWVPGRGVEAAPGTDPPDPRSAKAAMPATPALGHARTLPFIV
jgi:hypothetical protein